MVGTGERISNESGFKAWIGLCTERLRAMDHPSATDGACTQ